MRRRHAVASAATEDSLYTPRMQFYLLLTVRLLHFLFMALWIGVSMSMPGDVKRSFADGVPGKRELELLAGRGRLAGTISTVGGVGTLVTGLAMIFMLGGFGKVSIAIHISLLLAIFLAILGGGFIGGTWNKILAKLGPDGTGATREEIEPMLKRFRIYSMLFKTVWLVILFLMVFRSLLS